MLWCPVAGYYIRIMGEDGRKWITSHQMDVKCSHRFHLSDTDFLLFWFSVQYADH